MNMKKTTALLASLVMASAANAQKIDFNFSGRNAAQVTADGYTAWAGAVNTVPGFPKTCLADSMTLDGIKIVVKSGSHSGGNTLGCGWSKKITQDNDKLVGDGIETISTSNDGETHKLQGPVGELELIVSGLTPGEHTLLAYHNNPTNYAGPKLNVYVDGVLAQEGVSQTCNMTSAAESATSYVRFNVQEGRPVTIDYRSTPDAATDYSSTSPYYTSSVFLNAIAFDEGNPATMASNPYPADYDVHANCDGGTVTLTWKKADKAVKHHLFIGTDINNMEDKGLLTDTSYTLSGLYSMNTYYWKVKEVDAQGQEYDASVWRFQPRQLAFPGAEGYGRFAKGGRGGTVYHVTNLSNEATPGSLLYGLTQVEGPRTIVFDVSGLIVMDFSAVFSNPNITLAGQTAPGKGICLKHCNVNFGNDNVVRFLRAHRGLGTPEQTGNAMGLSGSDNAIADHVTAARGTDETFSSRSAKNITFQNSMIAEALGIAHHKNYSEGTNHGYAATIGGETGSFHHNLLADCYGRNWSMGGGLDGNGYYAGKLDIFNNVCYNWGARTTDGGAHEVNFVGNYYKEGPAVKIHRIFTLQLEGTGKGTQSAYLHNNIRDNLAGKIDKDAKDMKSVQISSKQTVDWTYWGTAPYFESHATIDSPELAYKKVLSCAGATQPMRDDHDLRMVRETRDRSWTYKGSLSGIKGEIDNEEDAGGWELFAEESRPEGYDTDQDGIPDWFEKITGTDPNTPNNNADSNHDGYTELEDYLNWMAEEHRVLAPAETTKVNMKSLFAGFTKSPTYTWQYDGNALSLSTEQDSMLVIRPTGQAATLNSIALTVTDGDNDSLTRTLNVAVTGEATGIEATPQALAVSYEMYTLDGRKVAEGRCKGLAVSKLPLAKLPGEVYVVRTKDANGKTTTYKVARR